jgi:hypothetical protein
MLKPNVREGYTVALSGRVDRRSVSANLKGGIIVELLPENQCKEISPCGLHTDPHEEKPALQTSRRVRVILTYEEGGYKGAYWAYI